MTAVACRQSMAPAPMLRPTATRPLYDCDRLEDRGANEPPLSFKKIVTLLYKVHHHEVCNLQEEVLDLRDELARMKGDKPYSRTSQTSHSSARYRKTEQGGRIEIPTSLRRELDAPVPSEMQSSLELEFSDAADSGKQKANGNHPKVIVVSQGSRSHNLEDAAISPNQISFVPEDSWLDADSLDDTANEVQAHEITNGEYYESSLDGFDDCKDGIVERKSAQSAKMHVSQMDAETKAESAAEQAIGPNGPKMVFADANAMKEKIRQAIGKPEYSVTNFYRDKGIAQAVARSNIFEQVTLSIISINALWIWIDTDYNNSPLLFEAHPVFQIVEHSFCLFFTCELATRFFAFAEKRNCMHDAWFCFDSALVTSMVVETWLMPAVIAFAGAGGSTGNTGILRLFRLFRLTRMARMARLMKALPELMIMIRGIGVASRSVGFTLALLMVIVYLFAVAFRQITDDTEVGKAHFNTVPEAMATLLLKGVLPDVSDLVHDVAEYHFFYAFVLLLFILLASLTVMNMLVGVLCEVISVVAAVEKEQNTVNFVKAQLEELVKSVQEDDDPSLNRSEMVKLLSSTEAARAMDAVGVDVVGLVENTDFIFKDRETISFPDFIQLVLELRGSNMATVKNIVDLQRFFSEEVKRCQQDTVTQVVQYTDKAFRDHDDMKFLNHRVRNLRERSVKSQPSMRMMRSTTSTMGQETTSSRNLEIEPLAPEKATL